MATTEVRPLESRGTLDPKANTIAVVNGMLFDYYSIKLGERHGPYIELVKVPPLIVEGFVTVGKQLYQVTIKDFIRRRVNVTSPYRATAATEQPAALDVAEDIQPSNQSAISKLAESVLDQAADLAWQDQIDSLCYLDDPEEEWILETSA